MAIEIFDPKQNRIGTVPARNLASALEKGYQLHNAGEETKIFDPKTKRTGVVPTANLSHALNKGYRLAESGWTDYGQAAYQGVATGIGKLADTAIAGANKINEGVGRVGSYLAEKAGAENISNDLNQFADESAEHAKDYWKNDKIAQGASDLFDTGLNHEKGIRVAKAGGEMVGTLPAFSAVGKGVQLLTKVGGVAKAPWITKINNFLETPITTKNAATFAGMGAGSEALKSDDPNTGLAENVLRELGGALLGGLSVSGAIHGAPAAIKSIGELLSRDKWYEALVKRGDTTLDKEVINATKNIGGKLDAKKIYKDNDVVSYIEKVFPNKAYQIAAKNSDTKVISSIEKSLNDSLGNMPSGVGQESTIRSLTSESESALQKLKQKNEVQNEALYDKAFSYLKPEDYPATSNSIKAAKEVLHKTYAPSTAGTTETGQGVVSSAVNNLIKNWEGKKIHPQEMVNEMRALKEHQRKAGGGYRDLLNSVTKGIEEDILASSNVEFLKHYKVASKDYATQLVPFVRLDAARALISGEKPNFIWEHMNTPTNRKEVQDALKIAGRKGDELFQAIKRVKSQEVIMEKISQDGVFKEDKFIELFSKLKPEDDIVDLIGKDSYQKIKKDALVLAKKMKEIKAQTAMVNQSPTANVLNKGGAVVSTATLGATTGFALGGIPGAAIGAVVGAYGKNWLAKGFAKASENPMVIERLIKAAEKNNDTQFIEILKRTLESTTEMGKSAVKAQGLTGGAKLINSNIEENKAKPKAPAFNKTIEDMYNNKYIKNFIEAD